MHTPKKPKREPVIGKVDDTPEKSGVERDKGYGPSHGYGPGHGGPSGPGDVPGDATEAVGKAPQKKLVEEDTTRPSESGPGEST